MRRMIIRAILLACAILGAGCATCDARARRLADPTPWDWIFDDSNRGTGWSDRQAYDPFLGSASAGAPGRLDLSGVSVCEYPCGAIRAAPGF